LADGASLFLTARAKIDSVSPDGWSWSSGTLNS
jgi:hypothetical protein